MEDLSRLCIHSICNRSWDLKTCVEQYGKRGLKHLSVWRNLLENQSLRDSRQIIEQAGMQVTSLVRGGFFPAPDEGERQKAVADNLLAIEQAAEIGAPLVVLVCGALPGKSVRENIAMIERGIEAILPKAEELNIRLGIEPLHPMYADTRSAINSMESANDVCERIHSPALGITVDVFHVWWEEHLEREIQRAGQAGRLFSFHVCDWKENMEDMLNDRGLMGEGIIDIHQIRQWVERAGFNGPIEVEIFSNRYWKMDQNEFLDKMIEAYQQVV